MIPVEDFLPKLCVKSNMIIHLSSMICLELQVSIVQPDHIFEGKRRIKVQ